MLGCCFNALHLSPCYMLNNPEPPLTTWHSLCLICLQVFLILLVVLCSFSLLFYLNPGFVFVCLSVRSLSLSLYSSPKNK